MAEHRPQSKIALLQYVILVVEVAGSSLVPPDPMLILLVPPLLTLEQDTEP